MICFSIFSCYFGSHFKDPKTFLYIIIKFDTVSRLITQEEVLIRFYQAEWTTRAWPTLHFSGHLERVDSLQPWWLKVPRGCNGNIGKCVYFVLENTNLTITYQLLSWKYYKLLLLTRITPFFLHNLFKSLITYILPEIFYLSIFPAATIIYQMYPCTKHLTVCIMTTIVYFVGITV